MTSQRGGGTHGAGIKAGRRRGLPRREHRVDVALVPRLLPLLLRLTASSVALLATSAHSSYPGPLAHTTQSTFVMGSTLGPLCGLSSPRTRTRRPEHPLPATELARGLSFVFPSRSPRSGSQKRSTGDPQAPGSHTGTPRGRQMPPKDSGPPARRGAEGALKARLGRSSILEQRPTTGPGVVTTRCGETTPSEGQGRWWSADYYTGSPKAESPLSQGSDLFF